MARAVPQATPLPNPPPARGGGSAPPESQQWGSHRATFLATSRPVDHVTKPHPAFAVELDQLLLGDRIILIRRGVELDPGQQQRQLQAFQARRLLEDVRARELVAALLENLDRRLRDRDADLVLRIVEIALGIVLLHEVAVPLDPVVAGELRVGRVLQIGRGDDADRLVETGRRQHRRDRRGIVHQELGRVPVDVEGLADRLRRDLVGRGAEEHIGAGARQRHDLRINRGIADLVGDLLHDQLAAVGAEPLLEAVEEVLAVIVVLIKHADLGVPDVLDDVFPVDHAFGEIGRVPAHGPRIFLGMAPLRRTGRQQDVRDLLGIHVFHDRGIRRRAHGADDGDDLVVLDELARLLDRLGRLVAVVERDQLDLAPVHPALLVDHVVIGGLHPALGAVGRQRPTIGIGLADHDLGVGDTGIVCLLGLNRAGR